MALNLNSLKLNLSRTFPIFLLYFLSMTEIDTEFSNLFEILSFNLQLIIIYYWMNKNPTTLGNGHIFASGIINDVIMGLPLGTSALSYLVVSFVASYFSQVTVNTSLFTDWVTFLIAVFCSNVTYLILIINFTEQTYTYSNIFYNFFFTFLFYPVFWLIFNIYKSIFNLKNE